MSNLTTSNTPKNIFKTMTEEYFVTLICQHLSEQLKEHKSVEVSPEEICQWFDVEFKSKSSMAGLPQSSSVGAQMPQVPGYWTGTGSLPPKKRGGRKKKIIDPDAPQCKYIITRGINKGDLCTKKALGDGSPGSDRYCKECLKKKSVISEIQNNDGDANKGRTVSPPDLPNGMVSVPQRDQKTESNSLDVIPIPGEENMFMYNNFVLERHSDNTIVAVSVEENGSRRPLNSDEKAHIQALGKGIAVLGSPEPINIPAVSQISGPPSIPQIPSVMGH